MAARADAAAPVVLSARALTVSLRDAARPGAWIEIVRGIDLDLAAGQVHALVGESGSGKTVTGFALAQLFPPGGSRIAGSVRLDGEELLGKSETELRRLRGKRLAMVFQEPLKYLDPTQKVADQLGEVLALHRGLRGPAARAAAAALLGEVELPADRRVLQSYPHQLSGGMRQRLMIARALAGDPAALIADEATSSLDANRRAEVELLLKRLCRQRGMALLFISHDLRSVARVADTVSVMYAGSIVERAGAERFCGQPGHPYGRLLHLSLPGAGQRGSPLPSIAGRMPPPDELPPGCAFHPRCPYAVERCAAERPALRPSIGAAPETALSACHRLEELWQYW